MDGRQLCFITRRAHPDTQPHRGRSQPHSLRLARRDDDGTPATSLRERSVPAAPPPSRVHVLTDEAPAVRFSAVSSGIGSLLIGPITDAVWELSDLRAGVAGGGVPAPSPGNRQIVERTGDHLILNLHHIRTLRRLVSAGADTNVQSFGGTRVINPGRAVTTFGVIDGQIEIRREPPTDDIPTAYTIGVRP